MPNGDSVREGRCGLPGLVSTAQAARQMHRRELENALIKTFLSTSSLLSRWGIFAPAPRQSGWPSSALSKFDGPGMTSVANAEVVKRLVVLIADSRPHTRALLRSMLLQLEVKKIHEVTDGAAALEALSILNPDVMILDWNLAVINARDVMRMARSSTTNPNPNVPIIVLSSSGQIDYVQEAMKHGTPYFMVWPISPKMLQQRLLSIVVEARNTARTYMRKVAASQA
jgi:two-component system chemotaxis response regulator CheY